MGSDLVNVPRLVVQVVAGHGDEVSGLAEMLQQFLQQNIESSHKKAWQAHRLDGALVFRSAEDPNICVRISFCRGLIEIADVPDGGRELPAITADFLSTAKLTTGESSPFFLLFRRRVRVRARFGQLLFLFRALRVMELQEAGDRRRRRWLLFSLASLASGLLAYAVFA